MAADTGTGGLVASWALSLGPEVSRFGWSLTVVLMGYYGIGFHHSASEGRDGRSDWPA